MNGMAGHPRKDESVEFRQCLAPVGSVAACCGWIWQLSCSVQGEMLGTPFFLCSGGSDWKELASATPEQNCVCMCLSVRKQLSLSITSVCVACTATGQIVAQGRSRKAKFPRKRAPAVGSAHGQGVWSKCGPQLLTASTQPESGQSILIDFALLLTVDFSVKFLSLDL